MPAIITNKLRQLNAKNFVDSFSELNNDRMYMFLGKSAVWDNEQLPETPKDSAQYVKEIYSDIIGVKKISPVDIVPVCKRVNWEINTVYSQYDDEAEIVGAVDATTGEPIKYYVMTSEFNIYKCISNNNGGLSTIRPTGTTLSTFQTSDGYIWKYMCTVNTTDAIKFMTPEWIPLRTLVEDDGSTQWVVQSNAVSGTVDHVIVQSKGSLYDPADPPLITITGDGSGAVGYPVINVVTGELESIIITNSGSGYTTVTVVVDNTGVPGSGAVARGVIAPQGGHGSNPVEELSCTFRMISAQFSGDEGGNLPLDVDYRRIGLMLNPIKTTLGVEISYTNEIGFYKEGDVITGQTSGAIGTVVANNVYTKKLSVDVVSGNFSSTEAVSDGTVTATITAVSSINLPANELFVDPAQILSDSANIIYINNRTKVTRFQEQDEQVKLVITF